MINTAETESTMINTASNADFRAARDELIIEDAAGRDLIIALRSQRADRRITPTRSSFTGASLSL